MRIGVVIDTNVFLHRLRLLESLLDLARRHDVVILLSTSLLGEYKSRKVLEHLGEERSVPRRVLVLVTRVLRLASKMKRCKEVRFQIPTSANH